MRKGFMELRARIGSGGGALDGFVRNWRWKGLLERTGCTPPPLPHFISSSSIRRVSKAPKLLLLGLLILQLLVLSILRASSSGSHLGTPAVVGTTRSLQTYSKLGEHAAGEKPPNLGELPGENPVLSTALDDAASQVSEASEANLLRKRKTHSEEEEIPEEDPQVLDDITHEEQQGTKVQDDITRDEQQDSTVLDDFTRDEEHEIKMREETPREEQQETNVADEFIHEEDQEEAAKIPDDTTGEEQEQHETEVMDDTTHDKLQKTNVARDITREELQEDPKLETKIMDENPTSDEEAGTHDPEADLLSASESAILEEDPLCKGGRIYVYHLPKRFNSALVANCSSLNPWVSLCDAFSNGGLGKPMTTTPWPSSTPSPWFYTEQFTGELIFHTRILRHPCTTKDATAANIFYVPFYAGLDVSRYLWRPSNADDRDRLGRKLVKWLSSQPAWSRHSGRDHFTMIGRITWDFRRTKDKEWGSGLLNLPQMKNMTRLIIERDPWAGGEFGVPYPTSFHPKNEHQVQEWQEFVRIKERGLLFSFAGATRRKFPNDFRLELLAQCSDSGGKCSAMDCSDGRCETPEPVMGLFLNSTFCLQPRGDTYTRRSIFDSMLAGCIPVFFWNQSSYWQYGWFFPEEDESFSVFIDREDVRKGVKIAEVLSGFSEERVRRMRSSVIDLVPRLVYAMPDHELAGADAFDTAIDGVLRSMLRMNLRAGAFRNSSTH